MSVIVTQPGINSIPFGSQASPTSVLQGELYDVAYFKRQTNAARERQWRYNLDPMSFVSQGTNTTGTDAAEGYRWFFTGANSGSVTGASAQAGYEGFAASVTGGTTSNTNSWISYDAGLFTTGRIFWCEQSIYMPIQIVTTGLYDIWLGIFNKQAAPAGTAPTDGAYFTLLSAAGTTTTTMTGNMVSNSGTVAQTAPLVIPAAATSIVLGMVYQAGVGAEFYYRLPSNLATGTTGLFGASDSTAFTQLGFISTVSALPRSTVIMRPTMAHVQRGSGAHTLNMEAMQYGIQNQTYR
jgi:hypothetical protein